MRNKDWKVVVAVVAGTTFDFALLQVPLVKSLNIRSNNRTSCSFTWNKKFKRKDLVKYTNELYVSLRNNCKYNIALLAVNVKSD